MTLTNFDASQITKRKQRKALNVWKNNNDAQVNLGLSVLSEQPSFQSNGVVVDRKLGASTCGCDPTQDASQTYQFNGLSMGVQVQ
jgi:hypothetical protein